VAGGDLSRASAMELLVSEFSVDEHQEN
jgi:hypothetical protein